jgi:hypothetical protein
MDVVHGNDVVDFFCFLLLIVMVGSVGFWCAVGLQYEVVRANIVVMLFKSILFSGL